MSFSCEDKILMSDHVSSSNQVEIVPHSKLPQDFLSIPKNAYLSGS